MAEKSSRIQVKRDPFERVKGNSDGVYRAEVVRVEYTTDKLGFELSDSNGNKIGVIDYADNFKLSSEYKAILRERGFNPDKTEVKLIGVDSRINSLGHQRRELETEQHQIEEDKKRAALEEQQKQKKQEEFKPQASSSRITSKDIAEQYKDVKSWTIITDDRFMDGIQPSDANGVQIDKENVVIARTNDGKFKVLAKELGTDKIIDLTPQSREINTKMETVNRVRDNNDSEKGKMCEFNIPALGKERIAVRETDTGHIIVESIRDTADNEQRKNRDESVDNKRETFEIDSLGNKSTPEEYERRKDLNEGKGIDKMAGNAILTVDEAYNRIPAIIREKTKADDDLVNSIRDEVMNNYVKNTDENPTPDKLKEYVENVLENRGIEDRENGRTLESDALDRINNRRKNH